MNYKNRQKLNESSEEENKQITLEIIEALNKQIQYQGLRLVKNTETSWSIYDNTDLYYGKFYITNDGRYEFSLVGKNNLPFHSEILLKRLKKNIALVLSDNYSYAC